MKNPFSRIRLPQTESYHMARKKLQHAQGWRRYIPHIGIGASLLVLLCAVLTPFWLPGIVRRVIPDRYVAAYAPQPLQAVVFESDPSQMLPTADPIELAEVNALLEYNPGQASGTIGTPASPLQGTGQDASSGEQSPSDPNATPTSPFVAVVGGDRPGDAAATGSQTQVALTGFEWVGQGWNNCGPATLKTNLSYWGWDLTQNDVANFVKPNPEDRNVRPDELAAYVRSIGYDSIIRVNGSVDLLKRLIAAGYPVMIEKGFDPEPDRLGWMGHYLLLTGYSEETQQFISMDSYLGADISESYVHIDYYWRHFNRVYLVAFPPENRPEVEAIIDADMDDFTMYSRALQQAQSETQSNPGDPFGWFNVGSNLVALGDYQNAATAFDLAREKGTPWRMLWYQFGPYEAYLHVGGNRLYDVITLANAVLEDNIYSEEAYYYKGLAYAEQGETNAARSQLNKALNYNTNYLDARQALVELNEG